MPKATKIKGGKFRLLWKGPYKVQFFFNNNTVKLSTLSNDDMEKVNINKLKEYQHSDTYHYDKCSYYTKEAKSRWDSYRNAKLKILPWTDSKPRPNEPSSLAMDQ
jgi:hypothetical protein